VSVAASSGASLCAVAAAASPAGSCAKTLAGAKAKAVATTAKASVIDVRFIPLFFISIPQ
jgi:hypothetical protein